MKILGRIAIITIALILLYVGGVSFAQGTHSITITWTETQNPGDPTVSYYVSRGTVTGGPYTRISPQITPEAATSYVDTTGVAGIKYFYIVNAVDDVGILSANSNEVSATAIGGVPNAPVVGAPISQ